MSSPQVVNEDNAKTGSMGQDYLACGEKVAMRVWNEPAGDQGESSSRDYEIVGYLQQGELEVTIEGKKTHLITGDSWTIPQGASHQYKIVKDIVAIEATSPPGRVGHKDE